MCTQEEEVRRIDTPHDVVSTRRDGFSGAQTKPPRLLVLFGGGGGVEIIVLSTCCTSPSVIFFESHFFLALSESLLVSSKGVLFYARLECRALCLGSWQVGT